MSKQQPFRPTPPELPPFTDSDSQESTPGGDPEENKTQVTEAVDTLPIVGIGASAGGREAIEEFLKNFKTSGFALVIVQHVGDQAPSHASDIFKSFTDFPVQEAHDGMPVERDHVYVLPRGHFNLLNRTLIKLPGEPKGVNTSIDTFLTSLAEDVGSHAIGVVLSGLGSDGCNGLAAIKEAGGLTFAQDNSAKFGSMPDSAVASGNVDFVLSPAEIARELDQINSSPLYRELPRISPANAARNDQRDLDRIFTLLRRASGVDFSKYKETTIRRRIYRRMVLLKIDRLETYIAYLTRDSSELNRLFDDLLINVTNFFRDPESFDALKERVFPEITAQRTPEVPIRIWVAGCSTGEEAYSIAIALSEYLGDSVNSTNVQIFGTDVSDATITKARRGLYPESIANDVGPERLRKYFKRVDGGYQISKSIRDLCIFARQNMAKDPPFSRIDLISCRNVLIYFGPTYQKQVIRTFHQALQANGYLMLGTSETIGQLAELFQLSDKKNKIYQRKSALNRIEPAYTPTSMNQEPAPSTARRIAEPSLATTDLQREADRAILAMYAPPGVIIDEDLTIIHFRGFTGLYLEPAPGTASLSIMRMARDGIRLELRSAIAKAKRSNETVRREGVQFKHQDKTRIVNITVMPIAYESSKQNWLLVLFEDVPAPLDPPPSTSKGRSKNSEALEQQIAHLQQELVDTKEYLQRSVEEHDAYNEELKSANEEIQSSNEELQSTNEELETAKEELQSINEELTTLNDELHIRNIELSQANNDLNNLLANVNFMVVMVGIDHRIRRFNPMAERILNIIPSDIGRPINDIRPNIEINDLEKLIEQVIDTLNGIEREVRDRDGRWYSLSIRPYKTMDNKIEGAVICLIDIDQLKRSLAGEARSKEFVQAMLDVAPTPLLVLNAHNEIEIANRAFYKAFGYRRTETKNAPLFSIAHGAWDTTHMRLMLDEVNSKPSSIAESPWAGPDGNGDFVVVGRSISEIDPRILLAVNRKDI